MSDLKQRVELLPCPFCGGKCLLEQTGKNQLTIECTRCHVKRQQKWLAYSKEWLEEKMTESWNTRTLTEREAKLVELLKYLHKCERECEFIRKGDGKIKAILKSLGIEGEG